MSKKVLITGITGQVGSQMADYLLAETDYDIVGMMRWLEPMNNIQHLTDRINQKDRISVYYADLNDYASMNRMILGVRPDFIFHLAAQSFLKPLSTVLLKLYRPISWEQQIYNCKATEKTLIMIQSCMCALLARYMGRQRLGPSLAKIRDSTVPVLTV